MFGKNINNKFRILTITWQF